MTLDRTFENEIRKAANGDGGRNYTFDLINELKEVSAVLANRYEFDNCLKKFGRAKVALCVAATILSAEYRYETAPVVWAQATMALWTNKCVRSISTAIINIHPAVLLDNSYTLRKLTMVQAAVKGEER
jgi:hypothetical protein